MLDVVMPELNGFDVCRPEDATPHLRHIVIFLSALGEVADKVSGLELGAADYITKPFQSQEVLARVRDHVAQALERELGSAATGSRRTA